MLSFAAVDADPTAQLQSLTDEFADRVGTVDDDEALYALQVEYLGKKGKLTKLAFRVLLSFKASACHLDRLVPKAARIASLKRRTLENVECARDVKKSMTDGGVYMDNNATTRASNAWNGFTSWVSGG